MFVLLKRSFLLNKNEVGINRNNSRQQALSTTLASCERALSSHRVNQYLEFKQKINEIKRLDFYKTGYNL